MKFTRSAYAFSSFRYVSDAEKPSQPSKETLQATKQKMQDHHGGNTANDRFWTRPQAGIEGVRERSKQE